MLGGQVLLSHLQNGFRSARYSLGINIKHHRSPRNDNNWGLKLLVQLEKMSRAFLLTSCPPQRTRHCFLAGVPASPKGEQGMWGNIRFLTNSCVVSVTAALGAQ